MLPVVGGGEVVAAGFEGVWADVSSRFKCAGMPWESV